MPKTLPASIMPKEFQGVIFITGNRGVGKSYCAAGVERPDLVLYLDFDDGKGAALHEQLNFANYQDVKADVVGTYGQVYKPAQMYEHIRSILERIESNRYTHAVLDNIDDIEHALTIEVKRDPDGYGIGRNPKTGVSHAVSGAYGGPWPAVNNLISGLVNVMRAKGIKVVTAIAHTKDMWGSGGPVPNKRKVRGVERWQQMSILSLVVIPGTPDPIPPAALVQKEALGKLSFDTHTGKFEKPIRRLPLRLPEANFDEIRKYLKKPADLKNPKPGEVPTFEEQNPFSDKFSKEQLAYMTLSAQIEAKNGTDGDSLQPQHMTAELIETLKTELKTDSAKVVAKRNGLKVDDLIAAGLVE